MWVEQDIVVDLMGEYSHKVDAKGRLSLPARFRKELSEDLVVSVEPTDSCLYVFEVEDFNDWVAAFFEADGGFDPRNRTHVAARRKLKANGFEVTVDSAGRINIPATQRESVGIAKDVTLIGNTGYFEIWDAKRWEEQQAEVDLEALLYTSSQA